MKKIRNKTIIIIGSVMLLLLGIFHIAFWRLFNWAEELPRLSQDNSGIMQMANIGIICYLFSMSFILFACRFRITYSRVGKLLLLSISLFFAVRLVLEFIFPGGSLGLAGFLLFLVIIFGIPIFRKEAV